MLLIVSIEIPDDVFDDEDDYTLANDIEQTVEDALNERGIDPEDAEIRAEIMSNRSSGGR